MSPASTKQKPCVYDEEYWAAIERQIRAALNDSNISRSSLGRIQVQVGGFGIVLDGEMVMGWERDLAKVIAGLHNRGLPVYSRIRLFSQATAPFFQEHGSLEPDPGGRRPEKRETPTTIARKRSVPTASR